MRLFYLFLFLGLSNVVFGQKFLQIEKYGSAKVRKFYIGEELSYQLQEDKTWYIGTIQDLIIDENIILLENRYIRLENIRTVRIYRPWSQRLGNRMYAFAGSWLVFSGLGTLVGWELGWDTAIIPASALVGGFLVKKIFKYKKYKIGKKRRLRMLDISMNRPFLGP